MAANNSCGEVNRDGTTSLPSGVSTGTTDGVEATAGQGRFSGARVRAGVIGWIRLPGEDTACGPVCLP